MAVMSEGLIILLVGVVSLLLGMAAGILTALHSYAVAIGALVLSVLGWWATMKLATRF